MIVENLDKLMKEIAVLIKENTYENEQAGIFIRELLDIDKEYDWLWKK